MRMGLTHDERYVGPGGAGGVFGRPGHRPDGRRQRCDHDRRHVEHVNISERWSSKRQREEVEAFRVYLNKMGSEGWEMISYESVPLTGHFSGNIKGYAYLTFFK